VDVDVSEHGDKARQCLVEVPVRGQRKRGVCVAVYPVGCLAPEWDRPRPIAPLTKILNGIFIAALTPW
jgi:hypothetical protein